MASVSHIDEPILSQTPTTDEKPPPTMDFSSDDAVLPTGWQWDDQTYVDGISDLIMTPTDNANLNTALQLQPEYLRLFVENGSVPTPNALEQILQTGIDPNLRLQKSDIEYLLQLYIPGRRHIKDALLPLNLIHVAALLGHTALTQLLIAHGAFVNGTEKRGEEVEQDYMTPLMVAAANGNLDTMRVLLRNGAMIDFLPAITSALYLGVINGRDSIVTDFLGDEAFQNYLNRDRSIQCALWGAVENRKYNILDTLLNAGATAFMHRQLPLGTFPTTSSQALIPTNFESPFAVALHAGDSLLIQTFLNHSDGNPIPLLNSGVLTALHKQLELGNIELFKALSSFGYSLRALVSSLNTHRSLLSSAREGNLVTIQDLLSNASTSLYELHALRLFFVALENGKLELAKYLLDIIAETNKPFATYAACEGLDFLMKTNSPSISDIGDHLLTFVEINSSSPSSPTSELETLHAFALVNSPIVEETMEDEELPSIPTSFSALDELPDLPTPITPLDDDDDDILPDAPEPAPLIDDEESLAKLVDLAKTDKFKNHFKEVELSLTSSLDATRLMKLFFDASTKSHKKFVDASLESTASGYFKNFAQLFPSHLDLVRAGLETVKNLAESRPPSCLSEVYGFIHVASCMDIAQGSPGRTVSRDILEQGFRLWRDRLSEFATLPFTNVDPNVEKESFEADLAPPYLVDEKTMSDKTDDFSYLSLESDVTSANLNIEQTYNERALLDEIALAMVDEFESAMAWIHAQTEERPAFADSMDDMFYDESSPCPDMQWSTSQESEAPKTDSCVEGLLGTFLFVSAAYFFKSRSFPSQILIFYFLANIMIAILNTEKSEDAPRFSISLKPQQFGQQESVRAVLLDGLADHGFLPLFNSVSSTVTDAVDLGWVSTIGDTVNFLICLAKLAFVDLPREIWKHTSTDFRLFVSNMLRLSCNCASMDNMNCGPSLFGGAFSGSMASTPCTRRMDKETAWSDRNIIGCGTCNANEFKPFTTPPTPASVRSMDRVQTPYTPATPFIPPSAIARDYRGTFEELTPISNASPSKSPISPVSLDLPSVTPMTPMSPPLLPPPSASMRRRQSTPSTPKRANNRKSRVTKPAPPAPAIGKYVLCDVCGKSIALNSKGNSKSNLIKHKETHSKSLIRCTMGCPATFTRRDNMKAHVRTSCPNKGQLMTPPEM